MANEQEPVMDIAQLRGNTGDDAELAVEIIALFREQVDMWSRMLDASLPASQWADAAHTLKGAALGAGAKRLAAACAIAESTGRADQVPSHTEAAVVLAAIKDEIPTTLEAVAKLSHTLETSGTFPV